jgi:exosortase E/protease (VPEID-CTERM system)
VALPWRRWVVAAGLLLAEYLWLTVGYDIAQFRPGFRLIGNAGAVAPIVFLALTATLTLWRSPGPALLARLARALDPSAARAGWLLAHAAALAALVVVTRRVLGQPPADDAHAAPWLAAWVALVGLLVATALAHSFPRAALRPLAAILGRPVAVGAAVGLAAWGAGHAAQGVWPWLARATLTVTAAVMAPLFGDRLFVSIPERLLGLGGFLAEVGNECSGAEGMGLVGVLSAAYLIKFRRSLVFPRALAIVPMAMGLGFIGNVVRIAALVWIGATVSPEVAEQGFHSKAGWVITCAIAIAVLTWERRSRWIARPAPTAEPGRPRESDENPTATYLMPLLVSLALALVTGLFSAGFDHLFWVRVLGTALTLWLSRAALAGAFGRPRSSPLALAVGVACFGGWMLIARRGDPAAVTALQAGLAELGAFERTLWVAARVVGAVVIVPLAEELAFRGYLLRRLVRDDFWEVDPADAARRPGALAVSALVFGALHGAFVAGTLVGVAYALLLRKRGRLGDAVVAHAVTNALLVVYTLATGDWSFMV